MSNDSLIEIFERRLTGAVAQREAHKIHRHVPETKTMEDKIDVWEQAIAIIHQHQAAQGDLKNQVYYAIHEVLHWDAYTVNDVAKAAINAIYGDGNAK